MLPLKHPTMLRPQVIDKYQVKQFYTAPTAIRSLMRSGDEWVKKHRQVRL